MSEPIPNVSECLEAAVLEARHAAASDELRDWLGLRLEHIDGAVVSIVVYDPSILLNRAMGLGLARAARPSRTIHTIEWAGFEPTVLREKWVPHTSA